MYQRALSIDPNHVSGLCNYALLMRDKLGDIDGAREMLERARKADPDDVWFKEVSPSQCQRLRWIHNSAC